MSEPRNQFTFYRSYFDALVVLPKKDKADAILAVCAYALYEEIPSGLSPAASAMFQLIKPTLDSGRRKATSGALGGEAKRKQNGSKTEAKRKQNGSEKEKEVEVEIENECKERDRENPPSQEKQNYGEYGNVLLTDEDIELLKAEFSDYEARIERLSSYIESSGKTYNNHLAVIRTWAREEIEKRKQGNGSFDTDEFFNAALKKSIER